jgi:putative ABC transport system permease protein
MNAASVSTASLFMASSLVLVTLFISYWQRLHLEKGILTGAVRAVVQLSVIGYILVSVFNLNSPAFTTFLLFFMIFNAAYNAAKRGRCIRHGIFISFLSIGGGTAATLSVLIVSGTIEYTPYQIIPVSGMIIGNAMVALGLCYRQMTSNFQRRRDEVETKLALGADIGLSSREIIRDSIKTGMVPTIDSAKTLGIVSLPGMMTGLILAGVSPIEAVKYQIIVTFMLLSATSLSSVSACYLSYKSFFNARKQLIRY